MLSLCRILPCTCAARVHRPDSSCWCHLQGLLRYGATEHRKAFECIPYMNRTMLVRSYQSAVWNSMASLRVRRYGPKVVVGDLVVKDTPCKLCPATGSADGESGAGAGAGAGASTGDRGSPQCSVPHHLTLRRLEAARSMDVVLVETTEQAARYSVFDVVLPLFGKAVMYPTHDLREACVVQCPTRCAVLGGHTCSHECFHRYYQRLQRDGALYHAEQLRSRSGMAAPAGHAASKAVIPDKPPCKEANPRGSYRLLVSAPWDAQAQLPKLASSDANGACGVAVATLSFCLPASSFATMCVRSVLRYHVHA